VSQWTFQPDTFLVPQTAPSFYGAVCVVLLGLNVWSAQWLLRQRSIKRPEEHVSNWNKRRQNGYDDNHVSRHILSVMTTLSVEIHHKAVRGHARVITLFRRVNVSGAQVTVWRCGLVSKIAYHETALIIVHEGTVLLQAWFKWHGVREDRQQHYF